MNRLLYISHPTLIVVPGNILDNIPFKKAEAVFDDVVHRLDG